MPGVSGARAGDAELRLRAHSACDSGAESFLLPVVRGVERLRRRLRSLTILFRYLPNARIPCDWSNRIVINPGQDLVIDVYPVKAN